MDENILNPLHTELRPNAVNQPRVIQTHSALFMYLWWYNNLDLIRLITMTITIMFSWLSENAAAYVD